MMRPAPATQPWPESVNWTAASAGGWPVPGPEPGGVVAVAEAPPAAQDADDVVPGELAELAEFGVEPVPALLAAGVPAGRLDPAAADPDDVVAQPAARPPTAKTASAEAAARRARDGGAVGPNVWFARALKGISFVTFQMTLYPLARLYRVPSVQSWGLLGFCWVVSYATY
jgi:hypothetical protein